MLCFQFEFIVRMMEVSVIWKLCSFEHVWVDVCLRTRGSSPEQINTL